MLRIEVDLFSGRPNPVWIITDPEQTKRLLAAVSEAKAVIAKPGDGFTGLGFREILVTHLADDPLPRKGIPKRFALASIAATDFATSGALAPNIEAGLE